MQHMLYNICALGPCTASPGIAHKGTITELDQSSISVILVFSTSFAPWSLHFISSSIILRSPSLMIVAFDDVCYAPFLSSFPSFYIFSVVSITSPLYRSSTSPNVNEDFDASRNFQAFPRHFMTAFVDMTIYTFGTYAD